MLNSLPSARMRSEGYGTWSVCVCVLISDLARIHVQQEIPTALALHG